MTLFNILVVIIYVAIVIIASKVFRLEPWSLGFVGAVCMAIAWVGLDAYRRIKANPKCQNPECKARRYKIIGWAKDIGVADSGVVFECKKCGEKYLQMPETFMKLDKKNQPVKYMKRLSLKDRWEKDE